MAFFGQEQITTEMPNLFLRMAGEGTTMKRPAAVMKRPSKASKRARSPDVDAVEVGESDEDRAPVVDEPGPAAVVAVDASSALTVVVFKTAATGQSYVQAKLSDGKKKLLVSIPSSMSKAHQEKMNWTLML